MSHKSKRTRNVNVAVSSSALPWFMRELGRVSGCASLVDTNNSVLGVSPGSPFVADTSEEDSFFFSRQYLREQILTKFDDGKPSPDKVERTWKRFEAAEEACARANARLSHPPLMSFTTSIGVWSVIDTARRKIEWLLGECRSEEIRAGRSFTSGASLLVPKRNGHAAFKYSGIPETTVSNLCQAGESLFDSQLWLDLHQLEYIYLAGGNRVQCVPKNYKTDRTIAIEPSMNMYVQKGIGTVIRRRLKRVGIDLDSQVPNQLMALKGSREDNVATIDLSMASDTVSIEIVRQLLPPDWFLALEQSRSTQGVLPSGEKIVYRKFSSMGNGYTFELETLIFWALTWAVSYLHDGDMSLVKVYGDDLTVDSTVADQLMDVLSFCGFTINASKTYINGYFRESCGKHYHRGNDVTPFYVRRPVDTLSELFKLHNKFYRWIARNSHLMTPQQKSSYLEVLKGIRDWAPDGWRSPRIPDGIGDGAFIGSFDECLPSTPANTKVYVGWEGWRVKVLAEVTEVGVIDRSRLGRIVKRSKKNPKGFFKEVKTKYPRWLGYGYLLSNLSRSVPFGWKETLFPEERAGLSLASRHKIIEILVPHYDGEPTV